MKKKSFVMLLITALLLPLLTVTAFAAVDDIDNAGMLHGIGGFFRDIYNHLSNGFNSIIDSISVSMKKIIDSLSRVVNSLLDGLQDLFVPSDNYFTKVQNQLQNAINNKLGGVLSITEYLKSRFALLSAPADLDRLYILEFPQGHIFGGTRIDLLMRVRDLIPLFRGLITFVTCVLPTIIFSYWRLKSMVNT